jgi:hypothetical protein
VLALDSQTLSITTTCFQCHGYGRRTGLKIRPRKGVWVQVPPSVLRTCGKSAPTVTMITVNTVG